MAHMTATHLDAERLRKKGWTPGEIEKAKGIFEKAETAKHPEVRFAEHVRLWTIVVAMLAGSVGASIALFPVLLFAHPIISTAITLLLGILYGLLLAAVLDTLTAHHTHRHHAMSWLVMGSVITVTICIALLERRYEGIADAWYPNPLLLAFVFTAAMTIPYLGHRRLHGHT
ncbi:TPA: hypothetical protein HA251_05565 [Candidatus Woesearchaeota archaeon]|nr:hypothetical protein [Candidatus Woesearchaeota archaeon]